MAPEATEDRGVSSLLKFSGLSSGLRPAPFRSGKQKEGAPLNSCCPLRGHRVYEVKNDNVAPFLLYAGPTLPDLAILCRIATWGRSLRYFLCFEAIGAGGHGAGRFLDFASLRSK